MASVSSPIVFSSMGGDVRCVVHGDDITLLAFEDQLRRVEETMRSHCSLMVRSVLGPELDDMKEISIPGRKLVWTTGGIVYEADPAHAKKIILELGLHPSSNGLEKPCVRETLAEIGQGTDELEPCDATRFRSVAACVNYLSSDRPDLPFSAKEVCRMMARPTTGCWGELKRLARYLVSYPRLTVNFEDTGTIPS